MTPKKISEAVASVWGWRQVWSGCNYGGHPPAWTRGFYRIGDWTALNMGNWSSTGRAIPPGPVFH